MPEFVVTLLKTQEEKYVVDAATDDHARLMVLHGEGHLVDRKHWIDIVEDVQPYRCSEVKP
jgi:hypothetical protein